MTAFLVQLSLAVGRAGLGQQLLKKVLCASVGAVTGCAPSRRGADSCTGAA